MDDFDSTHRGQTFRRFDFTDAVFDDTYLTNVRFKNVALKGARSRWMCARSRRMAPRPSISTCSRATIGGSWARWRPRSRTR